MKNKTLKIIFFSIFAFTATLQLNAQSYSYGNMQSGYQDDWRFPRLSQFPFTKTDGNIAGRVCDANAWTKSQAPNFALRSYFENITSHVLLNKDVDYWKAALASFSRVAGINPLYTPSSRFGLMRNELLGRFQTQILKKFYYGDVDANVSINLKTTLQLDENGDLGSYVFAPGEYEGSDYFYSNSPAGLVTGWEKAVSSKPIEKFKTYWASTRSSLPINGMTVYTDCHFKVSDWLNTPYKAKQLEDFDSQGKQLSTKLINEPQGGENYIDKDLPDQYPFVLDGNLVYVLITYQSLEFQTVPIMVFPARAYFNESQIPKKICLGGGDIELNKWLETRGGEDHIFKYACFDIYTPDGTFTSVNGYNNDARLTTAILQDITNRFGANVPIKIRCYPYGRVSRNLESPYMDVSINVIKSVIPTAAPIGKVCANGENLNLTPFVSPSGGTLSGSYLVSGTQANIKQAANENNFSPKFTYTVVSNGCDSKVDFTVPIEPIPVPVFENLPTYTCSVAKINLLNYVNIKDNATFSGRGVTGATFDPAAAGSGRVTITYTAGSICKVSTTAEIDVRKQYPEVGLVIRDTIKICKGSEPIDIKPAANIQGGTWSGEGVVVNNLGMLNATTTAAGLYKVNYTVGENECQLSGFTVAQVKSAGTVAFNSIPSICTNEPINLTNYVTLAGGTFSGPGIVGNTLYPSNAGKGIFQLTYTISGSGCSGSVSSNIQISGILDINKSFKKMADYCINSNEVVDLRNFINGYNMGSFSGNGVEGNYFYPARITSPGYTKIYYTDGSESCTRTIETEVLVKSLPEVRFFNVSDICTDKAVNLSSYVYPQGGTFEGAGVVGNMFYPKQAGVGEFSIVYKLSNGSCTNIGIQKIKVKAFLPDESLVSFTPPTEYCKNDNPINLKGYLSIDLGGTFSGTGVSNGYFEPAKASEGLNFLRYEKSENGCTLVREVPVTVKTPAEVTFNLPVKACSDLFIDLTKYVSPQGGTFSGVGVAGNSFYPAKAGVGNVTITYSLNTGEKCSSSISKIINVTSIIPENLSFLSFPEVCSTEDPINLRDYLSPKVSTGSFSGNAVVGNYFNPSMATTGANEVKFVYNEGGCTKEVVAAISVKAKPAITFNDIASVCDAATIDLTRFVSPQGGTFSGKGVSGTTFDPATAGVGVATITYSVTINGCTSTTNKQVRVEALIPTVTFTAIPSQCAQGSPINLRDYTSTTLGAYTGNGIIGNLFSPPQGQVGANAVVLTVTSGTCQRTFNTSVTVAAAPAITFNDLPSSCTSAPVDLSRYVSPLGGTFSGVGVSGSIFNPATAGEGTATITYTLNVNGCSSTLSKVATVNALLPVVTFADLGTVCQNGDPINLRSKVNVSSGTFSGSGVTGDYFYPSQATAGANEIIFRYGTGSCQLEVKKTISVSAVSPVTFATIPSICTDKAIDLSKFVNIAGGTFSGTGVTGNSFSPGTAGIGEFPITYTTTNASGCTTTVQGTATVNALIQPFTLAAIEDVCKLGDPINLRSYSSTNEGTFTGTGVTGDLFDPSKATIGLNTVTLKVEQSGCAVSLSKTIKVVDAPAVTFNLPSDQCGTANISLSILVNKQGGAFSGAGVTGSTFNPTTSGVGKFPITYTYSGTGCVTRVTREINVYDPIPSNITFSDIPSVCAQGSPVNLRALVNSAEGIFSGKGVVGDQFDPTKTDVGVNEVMYSITRGTGCSLVLKKNTTVTSLPAVTFNDIASVCDAATIDLTRFVSPQGGTFSGKGVSGTTFDPATAGVGVATITYSVTINGCTSTANKQVRVEALIPTVTFTAIPSQCAQGSPINLRDYTSTTLGAYTGNGIIGNLFSPSQGQVGANAVVLTVTSGTCQRTFNTSVTVAAAPAITFNDLPSSCTSAPVDLSRYVSPLGGTFSGVGVSGSIFNPATAGEGTATITYTLNVNGCSATSSKVATVNALLPVVTFADLGTVCQNGDPINLRSKVNVSSGTFSGSGVTGDYFYPSQATAGANEIIFRYGTGSCQLEVKKSISVSVVSPVTFATIPSICTDKAIDLSKFVNIAGGTFTGSGITGNSFSPGTAGIGEFPITYTFTNGSGCSATVGGTATVNALIQPFTLAAIEDVCKLGDPINLRSYTSTNEGTFTGSGVTGDLFDPSKATIGLNTVTLKVDQSGCAVSQSKTIKVVDAPAVTFNLPSDQCGTANISLTTLVNKQGGAFSGAGVTGSIFNPTTSGVGKFPITYTYSGTGCVTRVTREINVYDPIPSNISFSDIPSVCAQGSPVNLRALVNSAEGTFYGKGVVGDQLDPTKADVGVNEVTFSINRGTGCSLVLRKNVTVKAIPSVKFNAIPEICRDKPINLKRYVNMYGGTFAGSGVKDTLLYPASMPIGENTITYNYKEATTGCEYQFNQVVKVKAAMKDLAFSTIDNICSGIPRIDLSKQVNIQGGVFTTEEASAITSNFFSPTSSGIKTVKYMVDDNGCSQMASQTFEVYQTPALLFNYLPIQNTKVEIDLLNFVNISGGVFVGDGIAGTRFSPDKAGSGDHKITYTVTSSKGCSITKEQTIKVDNVIDFSGISVGTIPRLCANSEKVNLLPYVNPKNGTFSGQGVELGLYFNPQGRVGLNELKYTLTIGGNTYDKNLYINVDNDNSVKFLADTIKLCGGEGGVKSMVVNSTFDYTKSGDISLNGKYMAKGYSTQPYEVVSLAGCSTFKNFIINNAWVDPIDFSASTKVTTEGGLLKFTPSKSVDGLQTKWTFGDGGWSGEKTPSYYFYQTGMFNISLCITNAGGCQYQVNKDGYVNVSSDGAKFSAIMVGGKTFKAAMIASKPEVTQVKVYPNPFNTYINLMLPSELEGKDNEYNILTSMGMLVKSGKVRTSGQLDLSSLQLGVYILRINNQLIKLIKNE